MKIVYGAIQLHFDSSSLAVQISDAAMPNLSVGLESMFSKI